VDVSIKDAKKLVLFVKNVGNGNDWDHVVWLDPVLKGQKGTLKLTELKWVSATSGWGDVKVNRTCDNKPIVLDQVTREGIGAHSESTIVYELPEGYDTFTATGVVTQDRGSVVFGVLADKSDVAFAESATVGVQLKDLNIKGKVKVRDLWSHKDLGVFDTKFSKELPLHGAGLYLFSPVQ
jgi:alpha-galactosidase